MNRLDGKVALISGAARGIGAETARLMAKAGAAVAVADILEERARQTAGEITAAGGKAVFVPLDVTKESSWTAAVGATTKAFGGLDILVNNAGMFLGRDFEEATLDDWHKLVAINMTGVFLGTKLCAAALRESGAKSKHGSAIAARKASTAAPSSIWHPLPDWWARSSIRSTR
jgi:3(or 17)beta-hydroxysteroid dehydrogenase